MRSVLFVLFLANACAHSSTGPQPVNVAAVRNEINGTIRSENGGRTIHSMGKTRADAAIVYTTTTSGEKLEETWVKTDGRWKLQAKVALETAE
jgi:hypothetical protein